MARTEPRTREQMMNRRTAYEVVLIYKGETVRLGFSERKTREVLFRISRQHSDMLLAKLDEADLESNWKYSRDLGLQFGSARIDFSGRTERDCAH